MNCCGKYQFTIRVAVDEKREEEGMVEIDNEENWRNKRSREK
jgi:hypothetical protein